jgi:hypothetical protein
LGTGTGAKLIGQIIAASTSAQSRRIQVAIWLDPDNAGRTGAMGLSKGLSLAGIDTTIIRHAKEPKHLSNADIRKVLDDRYNSVTGIA